MIGSFLHERGASKLLPDRDYEIDRLTRLIDQLKSNLQESKDRRVSLENRKVISVQVHQFDQSLDNDSRPGMRKIRKNHGGSTLDSVQEMRSSQGGAGNEDNDSYSDDFQADKSKCASKAGSKRNSRTRNGQIKTPQELSKPDKRYQSKLLCVNKNLKSAKVTPTIEFNNLNSSQKKAQNEAKSAYFSTV